MRNQKQIWLSNMFLVPTCQFSGCKMCCNVKHGVKFFSQMSCFPPLDQDQSQKGLNVLWIVLESTFVVYFHSWKYKMSLGSYSSSACTFSDVFLIQIPTDPYSIKTFMFSDYVCQNGVMLAIFEPANTIWRHIFLVYPCSHSSSSYNPFWHSGPSSLT